MEKRHLFAATLLAVSLASCESQHEEPEITNSSKTKLELTITGTHINSRATGSSLPTQADENTIDVKDLWVGVFNSDGTVNVIKKVATLTPDLKASITCNPSTDCSIIVVANSGLDFSAVTSKTDFESKAVALSHTAITELQVGTRLPMSGESKNVALAVGETAVTTTVVLHRLVARVSIDNIKTQFSSTGQYKDATFKVTKIFLYNALENSQVAVGDATTTMPATPSWLHHAGLVTKTHPADVDVYTWDPSKETAFLLHTLEKPVDITTQAYTTKYWFYAFANNSTIKKTKLVIAGEFDPDGASGASPAETVYYPIVVNKAQAGTTNGDGTNLDAAATGFINRNSTYSLTATIRGKGSYDPEIDVVPVALELTVSAKDWELNIVQNVEFN